MFSEPLEHEGDLLTNRGDVAERQQGSHQAYDFLIARVAVAMDEGYRILSPARDRIVTLEKRIQPGPERTRAGSVHPPLARSSSASICGARAKPT